MITCNMKSLRTFRNIFSLITTSYYDRTLVSVQLTRKMKMIWIWALRKKYLEMINIKYMWSTKITLTSQLSLRDIHLELGTLTKQRVKSNMWWQTQQSIDTEWLMWFLNLTNMRFHGLKGCLTSIRICEVVEASIDGINKKASHFINI